MEEVLSVPTILIQYLAAFTANDLIVQYANLKDHLIKKAIRNYCKILKI